MSHPVLSICSFKTDWNIILILSLLPCELLCCLSLLPPHSVIKEPLPQTWIFLLFPDRLLSKPEPHGISPWRSSYLFKVSILKQGGLESSKLISSVYFPVSMNSMITLFLSCPSSVSTSAEVTLWVSLDQLNPSLILFSPWQKWHFRYVLFHAS